MIDKYIAQFGLSHIQFKQLKRETAKEIFKELDKKIINKHYRLRELMIEEYNKIKEKFTK